MNEKTLHTEMADLREHFDERMTSAMRWIVGILTGLALSVAAWEFDQSGKISTNEVISIRNAADITLLTEMQRRLTSEFGQSNREISAMTEQIKAQSRTLDRMEKALTNLAQTIMEERSR